MITSSYDNMNKKYKKEAERTNIQEYVRITHRERERREKKNMNTASRDKLVCTKNMTHSLNIQDSN